jgi:hypothetical protein
LGCYNQSTRSESVLIQTRLLRQFLINYPNPTRHVATSLETMVDIMRSGFMVELERIRLGEEAKASKTLDDDMGKTGGWAPKTTPEVVAQPAPLSCASLFARTRLPCSSVMRVPVRALLHPSTFARTRLPCSSARRPRSRARGCPAPPSCAPCSRALLTLPHSRAVVYIQFHRPFRVLTINSGAGDRGHEEPTEGRR